MNLGLHSKRAFVSGSTAGIGLATARLLAAEGASVIVNGRTQERVDEAVRSIRESVPNADVRGIAADLGSAEGCAKVVSSLPDVDVLVNNVAVFAPVPFEEIPDSEWLRFFETNVMSGVRLSRAWLPGMRDRDWGRVVFVSSESALQIPAEMIHYGMTKTAQLAIARGLAETTAGTGITVNSVLPGPTASEGASTFLERNGVSESEFFTKMRPSSLLQRFAMTDEVAAMIVYACSTLASATNGAALRVDGGVVRAIA